MPSESPLSALPSSRSVGVEVHRLVRTDGEGHRATVRACVVPGFDGDFARLPGKVDDPHEPLAPPGVGGRGKQRHGVRGRRAMVARLGVVGHPGEVRQVPGRAREKAHHLDRLLRAHHELPLAGARAERAGEIVPSALELRSAQHARRPRRHRDLDHVVRRPPLVVNTLDADLYRLISRVHEAKPTHLVLIPARIEGDHPVHRFGLRHEVVKAGEETVLCRPHVGQHLEVEGACQLQAPVPLVGRTRPFLDTLLVVAALQVVGVEVHRLVRADGNGHRTGGHPRIVECLDVNLARAVGAIDDSREALAPERIGGRGEERNTVHAAGSGPRGNRPRHGGGRAARTVRLRLDQDGVPRRHRPRGTRGRCVHGARHPRVRLRSRGTPELFDTGALRLRSGRRGQALHGTGGCSPSLLSARCPAGRGQGRRQEHRPHWSPGRIRHTGHASPTADRGSLTISKLIL